MILAPEICNRHSDEELMRLSAANMDYFSCIYQRYESPLLIYIQRITAVSEASAEDILQDAFIKVWKNIHRYRPDLRLSSWLYRIVHNEAVSAWRKNNASPQNHAIGVTSDIISRLAEDLTYNEEQSDYLQQAVANLENKYREIIILKYYEDKTYEEISDILSIPEGTVAIRLNRARNLLRRDIQENKIQQS